MFTPSSPVSSPPMVPFARPAWPADTVRFAGRRSAPPSPPKPQADAWQQTHAPSPRDEQTVAASRRQFLEEVALTRKLLALNPQAKQEQIYPDLRVKHWWFWKNQLDKIVAQGSRPLGALAPEAMGRLQQWTQRQVEPAFVEREIAHRPFFQAMTRAFDAFGDQSEVTQTQLQEKIGQMTRAFDAGALSEGDADGLLALNALADVLPALSELAGTPGRLGRADVAGFQSQIQDRVPFLFDQFGMEPDLYIQDSLYRVGASETPPVVKKSVFERASEHLAQYEAWQKSVRWLQRNQVSDLQFLPLFSLIGATYGQMVLSTAPQDSEVYKPFAWANVFQQMYRLEGIYEGVGFGIQKLQLLLVRWNEEKPEKVLSQLAKRVQVLAEANQTLKDELEPRTVQFQELAQQLQALEDAGQGHSDSPERQALEAKLAVLQKELAALEKKSLRLTRQMDKNRLLLDKVNGVAPMSLVERLWRKPPKVLNDTLLMTGISMPLTLSYEYLFYNFHGPEGTQFDIFSPQLMKMLGLFTGLGMVSNVLYKGVIHTTQDKKRLYQQGEKDQLIAENTRQMFSALKGLGQTLQQSAEPDTRDLLTRLGQYYEQFALPLIGNEQDQLETHKKKTRQAKLSYSMSEVKRLTGWLDEVTQYVKTTDSPQEARAGKAFLKLARYLHKRLDKLAHIPLADTRKELDWWLDQYDRQASSLNAHVPERFRQELLATQQRALAFLEQMNRQYPYGEFRAEPLLMEVQQAPEVLHRLFVEGKAAVATLREAENLPAYGQLPRATRRHYQKTLKTLEKGWDKNLYYLQAQAKEEAKAAILALKADSAARSHWPLDLQMRFNQALHSGNPLDLLKLQPDILVQETRDLFANRMPTQAKLLGHRVRNADRYNPWVTGLYFIPLLSLTNVVGRLGMFSILDPAFLAQSGDVLARFFAKVWLQQHIVIRAIGFFQEKVLVLRHLEHDRKLAVQRELDKGGPQFYLESRIREAELQPATSRKPPAPKPD